MPELSDDQKERIAIEVEHLPPDEAQAEYERRVREAEAEGMIDAVAAIYTDPHRVRRQSRFYY